MSKISCVSLSRSKGGIWYYAINGIDDFETRQKKIKVQNQAKKDIETILGSKSYFCSVDNSFTVVPLVTDYYQNPMYESLEKYIYDLKSKNVFLNYEYYNRFNINNFSPNFYISPFVNQKVYKRNYTCAERKIIGAFYKKNISQSTIIVNLPPCFFCLPAITHVWFWGKKNCVGEIKSILPGWIKIIY